MRTAMRTMFLMAGFGVLFSNGTKAAPVPAQKDKDKITEEKLVGKWKLVKSDAMVPTEYEFVIEIKAKGELAFIRTPKDGDPIVSKGKYKLDGAKMEWSVDEGGMERGETSKLKMPADDKLILEDPDGIKEEFEKLPAKKAPKKDD